MGRLASYVAKKAMEGYEVFILNTEHAIMSGTKEYYLKRFQQRIDRGTPTSGPFYPKTVIGIAKRITRGMIPYKTASGTSAFKRVKFYEGIPTEFENVELKKGLKTKDEYKHNKYITIKELSHSIGGY